MKGRRDPPRRVNCGTKGRPDRDRTIARAVCAWFSAHARPMPWRITPRDPYLSLVSEVMLQQTQVSRVLEKWPGFVGRFPTLAALAAAPEQAVLAAWSGMGYYRRARHVHAAAREIVSRFGGRVPDDPVALRSLPGIGRYTAGAIASIVYGRPEPIVDGNVARVLLRVEGKRLGPEEGVKWAWGRAEELVQSSRGPERQSARSSGLSRGGGRAGVGPAMLNEGLMELGAVVCTPRAPRCGECPLARVCVARARGVQDRIPRAKRAVLKRPIYCATVLIEDSGGRVLVERRGTAGLWAGMWQAPTIERPRRAPTRREIERTLGVGPIERVERFTRALSHRDATFDVWHAAEATPKTPTPPGGRWVTRAALKKLALGVPQRRILLGTE